jgi:hypothetical protein
MPVYEGQDDEARHQLAYGRNCLVVLPKYGKHVPLGVGLVARLNVAFSCDSCGRKTDSAISQEVNDRYCTDFTHPDLDGEVTDCLKSDTRGQNRRAGPRRQPDGVQERGSSTGSTP